MNIILIIIILGINCLNNRYYFLTGSSHHHKVKFEKEINYKPNKSTKKRKSEILK
jgi:hypothetical protein